MNFQIPKNKRGDIPITILVIGVLAICILTIFSFYLSNRNIKNNFSSVNVVEQALITKERISLYSESLGFNTKDIEEIFKIKEDVQGKYINITRGDISVRYNLPK